MKKAVARKPIRSTNSLAEARTGLFRATLLFGSAVAALALIVVPEVDRRAKIMVAERADDLDRTVTGSIRPDTDARRYTIRRSVLDRPDRSPCIMFPDGSQKGAC